jgi:uncharacterized protein (DUF305 family)
LALLSPECHAQRSKPDAPVGSGLDVERAFLLWKVEDATAGLAKLHPCIEKHVRPELATLCNEAVHERETEIEIATYSLVLYGEKSPAARQAPGPQSSLEGAKFESRFLKQMIRQDDEGLKRVRSCLAKASQSDILNFCHLVERSRSLEIQLLQNQLCQLQKNCRWKLPKP